MSETEDCAGLKLLRIQSRGCAQTEIVAQCFSSALSGGETVSLEGDLGAGKTFFARAVARALGITESVTSPTFVLQKIYRTPGGPVRSLVHYDLYRIEQYAELLDIGFAERPPDSVVLAEWGDKFLTDYETPVIRIRLESTSAEGRSITITFAGSEYQPFLSTVRSCLQRALPAGQVPENGIY